MGIGIGAAFLLLDLPLEASPSEVSARYRALAKKYHPDTGGSLGDFTRLREAYETALSIAKQPRTCPQCEGRVGSLFLCPTCMGKGTVTLT